MELFHAQRVSDIGLDEKRFTARSPDGMFGVKSCLGKLGNHNRRAEKRQEAGNLATNALASAGDDGNAAV
jgi:hypothetical protein